MELGLANRTAVVLAGTRGLGLASARALLSEGANVAVCGRSARGVDNARGHLAAYGERVLVLAADVDVKEDREAFLEAARERFGDIDVLVCNSGGPPPATAVDVSSDQLRGAVESLLLTPVSAIRSVLPVMTENGWGRIIALTSLAVRQPLDGLVSSNTARSGLTAYLKTLSREVAPHGVTVNSICTGVFGTERNRELLAHRASARGTTAEAELDRARAGIPMGRLGDPGELGSLVAFLASARAAFLTGVAIALDGGSARGLV